MGSIRLSAALSAGQSQQFLAGFGSGVTWSLDPATNSGSITSEGLYTAPDSSSNTTVTVLATPASGTAAGATVTLKMSAAASAKA